MADDAPRHQWTRSIDHDNGIVRTSSIEMLSVLRCAAVTAHHDQMPRTAQRLLNDAEDLEQLIRSRPDPIIIIVTPS